MFEWFSIEWITLLSLKSFLLPPLSREILALAKCIYTTIIGVSGVEVWKLENGKKS